MFRIEKKNKKESRRRKKTLGYPRPAGKKLEPIS
jgi:hypothetical protein